MKVTVKVFDGDKVDKGVEVKIFGIERMNIVVQEFSPSIKDFDIDKLGVEEGRMKDLILR